MRHALRRGFICAMVFAAAPVLANGINPPRPAESRGVGGVDYRCIRWSESVPNSSLKDAKLYGPRGESGAELTFRLPDRALLRVPLARLSAMKLKTKDLDKSGFATAHVRLSQPSYNGPGDVQLRTASRDVSIAGRSEGGKPLRIALKDCQELVKGAPRPVGPPPDPMS